MSEETEIQNYTLWASVEKSNTIEKSDIFVIPRKYSVLIQTDKPVYQFGDNIYYRILVLDTDLKPYNVTDLDIEIFDGEGNSLPPQKTQLEDDETSEEEDESMFLSVNTYKGVEKKFEAGESEDVNSIFQRNDGKIFEGLFSYHYNIDDEARAGRWSLMVIVNKETDFATLKYFEVKEKIPPHFEVIIETKHDVQMKDDRIFLSVYGSYASGELVKGKVTVTPVLLDGRSKNLILKKIAKNATADYFAAFNFKTEEDLNIRNATKLHVIQFEVEFIDTMTNQKVNNTVKVRVHGNSKYIVSIVQRRESFKPGFPFTLTVNIESFDGAPVISGNQHVKIKAEYLLKERRCKHVPVNKLFGNETFNDRKKPVKGKASFNLEVPDTATAVTVTASFLDAHSSIVVMRQGHSDEYLSITAKKKTG